jgi:hypothetical protein
MHSCDIYYVEILWFSIFVDYIFYLF